MFATRTLVEGIRVIELFCFRSRPGCEVGACACRSSPSSLTLASASGFCLACEGLLLAQVLLLLHVAAQSRCPVFVRLVFVAAANVSCASVSGASMDT